MPFLLRCGMGVFVLATFYFVLGTVGIYAILLLHDGTIRLGTEDVTRAVYIQEQWPQLVASPVMCALVSAITIGLINERPWTRGLINWTLGAWFAFVFVLILMTAGGDPRWVATLIAVLAAWGLTAWYLYRKPSVVTYFAAVQARDSLRTDRAEAPPVASPHSAA